MNDDQTELLLEQYRQGEHSIINKLFDRYRNRLRQMVRYRLHPQVKSRVDESDIIQNTLVQATKCIDDYLDKPKIPFMVWLRWLATQQIQQTHRAHLDVQKRSAKCETGMNPSDVSEIIANEFVNSTPSQKVARKELMLMVTQALEQLKETDREILIMRHFEQMDNQEVAATLGMDPSTTSSRYLRALGRMRAKLDSVSSS